MSAAIRPLIWFSLLAVLPCQALALTVEVKRAGAVEVGETLDLRVKAQGVGLLTYSWRFGDGSPATPPSSDPVASHSYQAPGRYPVVVTVRDAETTRSESFVQIVHWPLLAKRPTRSSTIAYDAKRRRVWTVNPDNDSVTAIDAVKLVKLFERPVGWQPRSLAIAPDGTVWVVDQGSYGISVLDPASGKRLVRIPLPYASRPFGIAFGPNGGAAYVSLLATGQLAKVDPWRRRLVGLIPVGPEPTGIAVMPGSDGGDRILVTRRISPPDRGELTEVAGDPFGVLQTIPLAKSLDPDTEFGGRGVPNQLLSIVIAPDGKTAWVPSKQDNVDRGTRRDGQPLTFESTVRTVMSILDLANLEMGRIDLNNRDGAVAATFSALGDLCFAVLRGSGRVAAVDAYSRRILSGIDAVGIAPQGLALAPDGKLFVDAFLSRSVSVYDASRIVAATDLIMPKLAVIPTVEVERLPPQVLLGKQIFNTASDPRMNRDGYLSCASCHPDGFEDGRTWDLSDRGEGFRNTIALMGRRGTGHGPLHWSANFDEVQDFEHDIRSAFGGPGFLSDADFNTGSRNQPLGDPKAGLSAELDALASYLTSLDRVHPSPHRIPDGTMTEAARAGEGIFLAAGCAGCHAGPDFTDSASGILHNVGTMKATSGERLGGPLTGIDTPTLRGIWATAPYLHDGSASTLMEVISVNPGDQHGQTSQLSTLQREQLVAYLLQIGNADPEPIHPDTLVSPPAGCGCGHPGPGGAALLGCLLWALAARLLPSPRFPRRTGRLGR
jgi:DNA-binding beta-propeller fold protein YncE